MAQFHGARRILPERPAADVDRLVYAALAALVSCGDSLGNARSGARAGMDDVPAAAIAKLVFSHCDALADRDHSLGELHVPDLPGAGSGDFVAGRPRCVALLSVVNDND